MYQLEQTELLRIAQSNVEGSSGRFVIEPLLPGYGVTLGNALRRVLLSSLSGSAVSSVRIDGVMHEFSTLKGVREDVVDLVLNIKTMRLELDGEEALNLKLEKKGPGAVTVSDFAKNPRVRFVDPKHYICTLERDGKIALEVTLERGRGYVPSEARSQERLPIGTIAVDSIFSPVKKVHYEVEHTRVEGMTNFDRLTMELETDGTIGPMEALSTAINICIDHFQALQQQLDSVHPKAPAASKESKTPAKPAAKKTPKPKTETVQKSAPVKAAVKKAIPKDK